MQTADMFKIPFSVIIGVGTLLGTWVGAEESGLNPALDYFLTDATLWKAPAAEVEQRLKPEGLRRDAVSNVVSLGEPRDLMQREAKILGSVKVWNVRLVLGTELQWVTFDLMPPPTLSLGLSKVEFRNVMKSVQEGVALQLKVKSTPHPIDSPPDEKDKTYKVSSERWVGEDLQMILFAVTHEAGSKFDVQRLQLKVGVAAKGEPMALKLPTLKADRASGTLLLQDLPKVPAWPGKHEEWAVLEQAVAATGKPCDRHGIREYAAYGTSWAGLFVEGLHRLCVMSGVKYAPIIPNIWVPTEMAKLQTACATAAKKLGKSAPQTLTNLLDVNPDVLRTARVTPPLQTQFITALKQALEARRPLIWYGALSVFPQTGVPAKSNPVGVRLIIGLAEKEGEVIFADEEGRPAMRMKIPDAMAAAYMVDAITAK